MELINSILDAKENLIFPAYAMSRMNFFCDRFIRHGLWYPDKKIRLFDKRYSTWGGINPHDKIILKEGAITRHLRGELFHYCYYSEDELLKRNEEISTVAARSLFQLNYGRSRFKILFSPIMEIYKRIFFEIRISRWL